jgi:hypothetical protein
MTDDELQYYKRLQSEIKKVKEKISFIKACLESLEEGKVRWEFQISYNPKDRFYRYDINHARVRQMLLDDLMVYRDYLTDLERAWNADVRTTVFWR